MSEILLREILGAKFDVMPPEVQRMHSIERTQYVRGVAKVVGGKNPIAKLVHWFARLPKPTSRAPVEIKFVKHPGSEEWDRSFAGSKFHTLMSKQGACLAEKLVAFPVTFIYDVTADAGGFALHVKQVKFLGIPLPFFMRPSLAARAGAWRGRYRFSTWVGFWFCGRVVSYFGYLDAPEDA